MSDNTLAVLGGLHVDEGKLKGDVDEVVRSSVEETLNGLLDAEADHICRGATIRAVARSSGWQSGPLRT
jgi:hypothetical protein